jgi:hypothetical protein
VSFEASFLFGILSFVLHLLRFTMGWVQGVWIFLYTPGITGGREQVFIIKGRGRR